MPETSNMNSIWLPVEDVAKLIGRTADTVMKRTRPTYKGCHYVSRKEGRQTLILLRSLEKEHQLSYYQNQLGQDVPLHDLHGAVAMLRSYLRMIGYGNRRVSFTLETYSNSEGCESYAVQCSDNPENKVSGIASITRVTHWFNGNHSTEKVL